MTNFAEEAQAGVSGSGRVFEIKIKVAFFAFLIQFLNGIGKNKSNPLSKPTSS